MSDAPYEVLAGRYELHRQLATGGSADVFLARDQLLNRPVAVKILNETLSKDEAFIERLRQEAQLVASLNHQNIVGVFDQGEHEGAPFIVMEYVDGRSLAEILRAEGRLHPDRAATIAVDVAAALDAAHRQGMVHMDVKPGNVLITSEGQVKLADFGIAKALNDGSETDMTVENGTVMGTATYLSPEQAQGHKVGPRSDVYSLAVVLYEMIAGTPPFTGDTAVAIARKHVEDAPISPKNHGADIVQSLEAITFKGLAKTPKNRYPSVRDFAADLKRYLSGAHSTKEKAAKAAAAAGAATVATTAIDKPAVVRPVTGRSTAPEGEDPTVIIPATPGPSAPAHAAPAHAAPAHAAAVPTASPAAAVPQDAPPGAGAVATAVAPAGAQPIVVRNDDTWKRNILFFLALCILLVLFAFLAQTFLNVLQGNSDTDPGGPTTSIAEDVDTVVLQDFSNFERDQAIALIENAGLFPEIEFEPNTDVGEGRVFKQSPVPGAIVEAGSIVRITVSEAEGQVTIPPLVELTREEAEQRLTRLGFVPSVTEVDSTVASPGVVISQDPFAGTDAEPGSVVFLEVSLGQPERTVPDLAGQEFNEALNELFEFDFRTSRVDEPDPEVEEGLVLRTEPEAGSLLRGREIVTIYVSSGIARITVPPVEGLLADSARQQLTASGFEVLIDFVEVDDPAQINRVVPNGQTPPANTELREGESVTIVVGLEPIEEATTTTLPDDGTETTTTTTSTTTTTTTAAPDDGDDADDGN